MTPGEARAPTEGNEGVCLRMAIIALRELAMAACKTPIDNSLTPSTWLQELHRSSFRHFPCPAGSLWVVVLVEFCGGGWGPSRYARYVSERDCVAHCAALSVLWWVHTRACGL